MAKNMENPAAKVDESDLVLIDVTPSRRGRHTVELSNGTGLFSDEVWLHKSDERVKWAVRAKAEYASLDEKKVVSALQTLYFAVTQPPRRESHDSSDGSMDEDSSESQASALVRLAQDWELFHDPDGTAYATIAGANGARQTHRLSSKAARQALRWLYHSEKRNVPRAQAVQDALGVLEGKASFDGSTQHVCVRLASHDGDIYLDLGDESWQAIKISPVGWELVESTALPVKFRRSKGMLALPRPARGGHIMALRPFLNAPDEHSWVLKLGWLIGAYNPQGPYAILNAHGEQGSAKSTTLRVLRALIDPSSVPLRSQPREEHDLLLDATNGWVIAIDNVSTMRDWLSDALCRLSTGGGFSTRELYSDSEQTLLAAQRPCMTDGIEDYAARQDYLDRSVVVTQPPIGEDGRKSERAFWDEFEAAQPAILGAVLDAVSMALRRRARVTLERLPRMADFCLWVTAAEPALDWAPGRFNAVYSSNRKAASELALEASVLAPPLRAFVKKRGRWEGIAAELLEALNQDKDVPDATRKLKGWPTTAQSMGGAVSRLAPSLRAIGISVEAKRTNDQRRWVLVEGTTAQAGVTGVTGVTEREQPSPEPSQPSPFDAWSDSNDGSDGQMHEDSPSAGLCSDCGIPIHKAWGRCEDCRSRAYAASERECPL